MAIAPSGWDTSPSIRSLIAIAPTIVFKSFSGASACSDLDHETADVLQPSAFVALARKLPSGDCVRMTGTLPQSDCGRVADHARALPLFSFLYLALVNNS